MGTERSRGQTARRSASAAGAFAVLALALTASAQAAAQQPDGRWLPWLGCWEPIDAQTGAPVPGDLLVCLRATGGAEIEIATVTDGETSTRRIVANGMRREVAEAGCTGWESASWAEDGRRVFLRSALDCEGNIQRTQSGVMAWVSPTEWVDAQSIGLADERVPRVQRFRAVSDDRTREAGFQPVSADRAQLAIASRTVAAAPLSLDDVREAATRVDSEALQALLVERGEGFDLNAERLASLAQAGLEDDVIDLMVALSYPNVFRVDQGALAGEMRPEEERYGTRRTDDPYWRRRDPYGWYDPFDWGYYGRYSRYCSPYSYGYWSYYGGCGGWGYPGSFGYGYGFGGVRPIIIVRDDDYFDPGGRVVAGRGYTRTRTDGSDDRRARPRSGSTGSTSVGASRGATVGSSAGSSSSGSGSMTKSGASSSGSSRGTAKKRGGG